MPAAFRTAQAARAAAAPRSVVLGVDTHKNVHVAAVLDHLGGLLDTREFPATAAGYRQLLDWARQFGTVLRAGVECTGSYGAGLAHYLATQRVPVVEVNQPDRSAHDITAARHDHILAHLRAAGLGALADLGFRGLDNDVRGPVIVTGFHASRTHKLTPGQKDANRVLAVGRPPVEHGFAHLKNWRTLTKLRTDPARATRLLRALLVLTNLEVNR